MRSSFRLRAIVQVRLPQGTGVLSQPADSLIVPFPPGASTDLLARYLAPKLQGDARPAGDRGKPAGAAGTIGAAYVAKAAPDGHTLLVASSTVIKGPLLQKNPAFDATSDLAPVAMAFQQPFLLVASPALPAGAHDRRAGRAREGQSRQAQHVDARRLQRPDERDVQAGGRRSTCRSCPIGARRRPSSGVMQRRLRT